MKSLNTQSTVYNDKVVRQFAIMSVVWGVVGMLVGVICAAQLTWPELNLGIAWLSYGRLRPLHTNAVIFAFSGSALFATAYYIVQRTCQVRLFSDKLAAFTFWGWQAVIVAAAITLPLGLNSSKEYAELEWPIDVLYHSSSAICNIVRQAARLRAGATVGTTPCQSIAQIALSAIRYAQCPVYEYLYRYCNGTSYGSYFIERQFTRQYYLREPRLLQKDGFCYRAVVHLCTCV